MVKITDVVRNGTSLLNLDAFAPAFLEKIERAEVNLSDTPVFSYSRTHQVSLAYLIV